MSAGTSGRRLMTRAAGRPAVYLAHPLPTYGSAHERRCIRALRRLLPGVELVNPAGMFASSTEWFDRWPDVLDGLDALVVLPDERGAVGSGVMQELIDAHRVLLPVALFDPASCTLRRLVAVEFPPLPSPWDAGHPVAGEVLTWTLASRLPRIREAS